MREMLKNAGILLAITVIAGFVLGAVYQITKEPIALAKEAAAIFEAMQDDLDLAAKILKTMDAENRGKILGAMDEEVAARLTKIMDPES